MIERAGSEQTVSAETLERRRGYLARESQYRAERDVLRRRWNRLGNGRLLAFVVAAVFGFVAWGTHSWWPLLGTALGVVALIALIVRHRTVGRTLARANALRDINADGTLRAARDWSALPLRHRFEAPPEHAFARDLDLFGRASLFHVLDTTTSDMGSSRLAAWLLEPAGPDEVATRQAAVRDLTPELAWRQELETRGRLIGDERPAPEPLLAWAEGKPWLRDHRSLRLLGAIGPILLIASIVLAALGITPVILPIVFLGLNLVTTQLIAAEPRSRIDLVAEHYRSIAQYAEMLEQAEVTPGASARTVALRERLHAGGRPASGSLRELGARAAFAIPTDTLIYFPLQALLAWDLNVLGRIEGWQARDGRHARGWLDALGQIEALSALATLADDQPSWIFPSVDAAADAVRATDLGHPLLTDEARVGNDVTLGPPGSFLLVTGSNMSGKSTLLRAIGVNVVLAGAGGPVCAAALACPPVRVWTSVRVEDSLARGVSFFLAELQRLKRIVDAADEPDPAGRRLLFLLDEILQGTNTAERQIAARRVIRHLVDAGAIGAVSTHDLSLAEGEELARIAVPVHLRDTITAGGMAFDYKLRPGIATSTNALRLMEIVFGHRPT